MSVYDRLGPWFTLLRVGDADPGPLLAAAAGRGVPVSLVKMDRATYERADPPVDLGAPLVLVRPDQHVAWRGAGTPGVVERAVDIVRGAGRAG